MSTLLSFLAACLKALVITALFVGCLAVLLLALGFTFWFILGGHEPRADRGGSLGFDAAEEDAEYDDPDWPASDHTPRGAQAEAWLPPEPPKPDQYSDLPPAWADQDFLNVRHKNHTGQPCAD